MAEGKDYTNYGVLGIVAIVAVVGLVVLYNTTGTDSLSLPTYEDAITGSFSIHPYFIHRPACFLTMDRPCYDILVFGPTWITLKASGGEKLYNACVKMPPPNLLSDFPASGTSFCGSEKIEKVNFCELGSGYYITQFTGKCGNNTFPYVYG